MMVQVRRYFESNPARQLELAFRVHKKSRVVPMTGQWFSKKLMKVLARARYAPHFYSGYSFRSGGTTWAYECGLSGEMIRLLGD